MKTQSQQLKCSTETRLQPEQAQTRTHLLWLDDARGQAIFYATLVDALSARGLEVEKATLSSQIVHTLQAYTLILIVVGPDSYKTMPATIRRLRKQCRTPILLLTEDHSLEWYVAVMQAGADAAVKATTPTEIILAHCASLLRRWL